MKGTLIAALTAVALMAGMSARADDWPSKPITLIAPFPPGGSVDAVARILSTQLTAQLGKPVIVENKGGASGSLGTGAAARATPDGYTFLLVFDTHAVNPSLIAKLPFDTLKDFAPIMLVGTAPMAVAAHPGAPYKNLQDVIAASKAKPGSVQYGSISTGSLGHLAMLQIANLAGVEITHIPYKGGGPAIQDVIAGHIPLIVGSVVLVSQQVEAKRLVPLVVTSAKRYGRWPNVPTVAEQGFPGFEAVAWWGFLAPAATPAPILKRMHEELAKALKTPAVAEKLSAQGMDIVASSPADLDAFIRKEIDRWGKVVRDNKIKAGE